MLEIAEPVDQELLEAIDGQVQAVLNDAGVVAPPVDAVWLARRLGIGPVRGESVTAAGASGRGRGHGLRPLVQQRLAATAIGRRLAGRVARAAGLQLSRAGLAAVDRLAALFASRLLMPAHWFDDEARRTSRHLLRLQRRYATASAESVAWRLLHMPEPLAVTVFDQGHLSARRSNLPAAPDEPTAAESAAWAYAHRYSLPARRCLDGTVADAWPLHRPDWRRELVIALFDDHTGMLPHPDGQPAD